ncbi:MAG TPA: NADH-quinone oxidoreductase subunit M [Planctomycetota bacterium]|nr:NADH-quinone oxidoreductase subunit M [Planctomycetota bacterium]
MISIITFLPAVTALAVLAMAGSGHRAARATALFGSLATLAFALALLLAFDSQAAGYQFREEWKWVPSLSLGISYKMGIDGISLFMVVLTALITPIAILASWKSVDKRVVEFHVALLLLETGTVGVFAAVDLILFYVFWEVMLIPMYLLIGVWGSGDRIYAAVKFFIYTMAGSLLMFLAIIYLHVHVARHGAPTFDLESILETLKSNPVEPVPQAILFLAFAASFAIKVPLFPFHTWLPDAHTEAPTAGSVVLAAVLLKMGTYGFIRFAIPLFPDAAQAAGPWISALAVVGIVFGACMCVVQEDVKRLIAYSSVSHLGFVMLGIFALNTRGLVGGITQMVNHGISTGALFLLIGVIYERRHTRKIADYGGLARVVPRFAVIFFITTLSSIGLPFFNGFVGEFLILQGAFEADPVTAACAASGVVLGAVYMLVLVRRVFFGPVTLPENERIPDLGGRELGYLIPLVILMVALGLFSPYLTDRVAPSVNGWLERWHELTATR